METELCLQSVDEAELLQVEGGIYDQVFAMIVATIKQMAETQEQIVRSIRG